MFIRKFTKVRRTAVSLFMPATKFCIEFTWWTVADVEHIYSRQHPQNCDLLFGIFSISQVNHTVRHVLPWCLTRICDPWGSLETQNKHNLLSTRNLWWKLFFRKQNKNKRVNDWSMTYFLEISIIIIYKHCKANLQTRHEY